jgi:hypothetical protein
MTLPLTSTLFTLLFAPILSQARDITFPPQIPIHAASNYVSSFENPILDPAVHHSRFTGLTTFANLPYVYCLNDAENDQIEKFDIAFMGAGFDTVSFLLPPFWLSHWFAWWSGHTLRSCRASFDKALDL